MPQEVGNRLALLPRMTKARLLALWKELFRVPPPRRTRRGLLIKFLAHRMQEQAYGGLSPATRKRLRELARKFETNPNAELSGAPRIKPGTRLIRDWRGQSHRVTVLEARRKTLFQSLPGRPIDHRDALVWTALFRP